MPGATEIMTDWEGPAFSVKVLGEIVTPDGRLPPETEMEPVKPGRYAGLQVRARLQTYFQVPSHHTP